ncbi:MAG TPA: flavodoxin domain-containing protein [Fimbriimonas sp.]|nr:flavodoxin domain-containing protein [Fimbriimonas sp.]
MRKDGELGRDKRRVAIVIYSQYGQTLKIANAIEKAIESGGELAEVFEVDRRGRVPLLRFPDYHGFIVGAPIYAGKVPARLIRWLRENMHVIGKYQNALFTVSLSAASKTEKSIRENERLLHQLEIDTGMKPELTSTFAGAVNYREYGFLLRWIMKRICRSEGGPTDTSRDHELTDWTEVNAFAQEFLQRLTQENQLSAVASEATILTFGDGGETRPAPIRPGS